MTLTQLRSQARKYTRTNETNYVDATLDFDINQAYGEVWMTILEAEGYRNISGSFKTHDMVSTSGLVAGDVGYNGEYPFPSDALDIETIEVSYDGTSWSQAEIIDNRTTTSSKFNEDLINAEYSQSSPKVFMFRDSIFVRPLKETTGDITDGVKLKISQRQTALTLGTDSPLFESNFHNIIPLKVAMDFFLVHPEKYNQLIERKLNELEAQMIAFYQDRIPVVRRFQVIKEQF